MFTKTTDKKRTVALFGLSGNPPHRDHQRIEAWLRANPTFEDVLVIPVYEHVFNEKSKLVPFEHRLEMCKRAFKNVSPLEAAIAEAEGRRPATIDVVEYLKRTNQSTEYVLVMGADAHQDLLDGKWERSEELRDLVQVLPLQRLNGTLGGFTTGYVQIPGLTALSSSEVRTSDSVRFLKNALDPKVLAYIVGQQLYQFGEGA